jgi:ribonuclease HI
LRINIYTDGAARGNPGPGGYGVVMEANGKSKEFSGGFKITTNNRMELLAIIEALTRIKQTGHEVHIYSDSKYVVDAVEKGWLTNWIKKDFRGKKNVDLWLRYLPLHQQHQPKLHWIKGHNNHPQNERCDTLAVSASKQAELPPDEGFQKD